MKKRMINISFLGLLFILSCSTHRKVEKIDIDYVSWFTTTPYDVEFTQFYSYFSSSIASIHIADVNKINSFQEEFIKFTHRAKVVVKKPDTRMIIKIKFKDKEQVISLSPTILAYKGINYELDDRFSTFLEKNIPNLW